MRKIEFEGILYIWLSWNDVLKDIEALSGKIKQISEKIDKIVGVLRWGSLIAVLLSDKLRINRVYSVGCRHYTGIDERERFEIYQPLPSSFKSDCALIVDDVSDTGETLSQLKEYIRKKSKKVLTATLHVKSHTSFIPDLYARKFEGRVWICYPWSRYEFEEKFSSKYGRKTFKKVFLS